MQEELDGAKEILEATDDEEMRELAEMEAAELEENLEQAEEELKILLIPKDPNDEKNVILEIRAGTGGDEATLFAGEILRMYARFAETQGWKLGMMSSSETGVGGLKEAFAMIEGNDVYSKMRYESGVHRVPTRSANRNERTNSYFGHHGRCFARGRRDRCKDR